MKENKTATSLYIENPKWKCPKCGITEHTLNIFDVEESLDGTYCLKCLLREAIKYAPKVEKL